MRVDETTHKVGRLRHTYWQSSRLALEKIELTAIFDEIIQKIMIRMGGGFYPLIEIERDQAELNDVVEKIKGQGSKLSSWWIEIHMFEGKIIWDGALSIAVEDDSPLVEVLEWGNSAALTDFELTAQKLDF